VTSRRGTVSAALALAVVAGLAARPIAPGDRAEVMFLAAIPALAVAVLGAVALRSLSRRTIAAQVVVVALTTLAVVAIGARAAASAMFLSPHDLAVLDLVLVVAAGVALVAALVLARRLAAGVVALEHRTERIRADGPAAPRDGPVPVHLPAELATIAEALDALDQRLRDADERQRRLEASRRELVAWVSHDLRTPLAGIRALAEALEDGVVQDGETVARYHRTLRVETDRLARLVDDLFELSRQSAGVLRLQFERARLDELVSDVVAGATPAARAKGVELVGRADRASGVVVVSTVEFLRAVRNIVENAIRHTPAGGTVEVAGRLGDGEALVVVTDTGGGIAAEHLERIFDTGFSGDEARTPDGCGAGLGLAIARGLIEAHHGSVTAANVDGGARFVVTIPAGATDEPAPRRAPVGGAVVASRGRLR
jgi:signal transduction histidine kinase